MVESCAKPSQEVRNKKIPWEVSEDWKLRRSVLLLLLSFVIVGSGDGNA